ncbi:hypothetical protein I4543_27890 [Klebsiella michiganensis]|uniref:hypothetical protein n=1 Tax=Klebsiella michiganensis TaxID=1134687 RepID=UPI0018C7DC2B|nr:hypothetical protein [Klebsiella michiganensis]MBG2647129.1 hypothetical protein [Klebsiella michiganensis]
MTTDITELAQREKFEAWAEERCALPWGYLKNRRTNTGYFSKHDYTSLWAAWKAAGAELVEALEKAQANITKERELRVSAENRACGLSVAGLVTELETAQQVDYELCKLLPPGVEYMDPPDGGDVTPLEGVRRMVADYRQRIAELEEAEQKLCAANVTLDARAELAERRLAEMESRTVKLPDDEDGQAYGFGKWSNGKLPATAGTMTISYCEDAWRAAFEVFSSAAGIKVEEE